MDPDQIDRLVDVSGSLALLVILAMLLERALALIFEYHWFQQWFFNKFEGLKAPVALAVSWYICYHFEFDVLSKLFTDNNPDSIGILITAAIVAGGSAGAMTLFQGVLNFSREARTSLIEARKVNADAELAEAKARKDKAEAEAAEAIAKKEKAEMEAVLARNTKYTADEEVDSCSIVHIEHITRDEDLPAAEGGVKPL